MPTYVYEVILANNKSGQVFEVQQKMADAPLTTHPQTGKPVRRVITAPNIATQWTDAHAKHMLSDAQIGKTGLTKYVRGDNGKFEKAAGSGPDILAA
ncbi:MAG: hypothetical protein V3V20_10885 [Algisphaera sp.]